MSKISNYNKAHILLLLICLKTILCTYNLFRHLSHIPAKVKMTHVRNINSTQETKTTYRTTITTTTCTISTRLFIYFFIFLQCNVKQQPQSSILYFLLSSSYFNTISLLLSLFSRSPSNIPKATPPTHHTSLDYISYRCQTIVISLHPGNTLLLYSSPAPPCLHLAAPSHTCATPLMFLYTSPIH